LAIIVFSPVFSFAADRVYIPLMILTPEQVADGIKVVVKGYLKDSRRALITNRNIA
jgi:hypothetical protein